MTKEKILVSACLLGYKVRYNASDAICNTLMQLKTHYYFIPFCPECAAGLKTPRAPAEIIDKRVITNAGQDVTCEFQEGANQAIALTKKFSITKAILKSKSPSCGFKEIYDGSFSGTLTTGNGITAQALISAGIEVVTENNLESLKIV